MNQPRNGWRFSLVPRNDEVGKGGPDEDAKSDKETSNGRENASADFVLYSTGDPNIVKQSRVKVMRAAMEQLREFTHKKRNKITRLALAVDSLA
jgi:hypothetical protein